MRRALVLPVAVVLAACGGPPPASDDAPKPDSMAPSEVTEADAETGVSAPPAALPPPDLQSPAPVANDLGTAVADNWVGTWTGPEGTSLRIAKQEVGYEIIVTNLDGPRSFHEIAVDEVLDFDRDGVTVTVHAGDGAATGMKWLAGKKDCLVLAVGEGYCRD